MAGTVQQSRMTDKPQLPIGLKLALDLGPLVLFFVATMRPALFEPLVAPFLSAELLAVLNEVVWRTQSDVFWGAFKLFGVVPLTFVFAALQYPLLTKYAVTEPAEAKEQ